MQSLIDDESLEDGTTPRELAQLTLFPDAPKRNVHPSLSEGSPGITVEDDGTG
jgi:hypothetical protein